MNWVKILNFIDGIFGEELTIPEYGKLYKIKNELLPFRYVYVKGDDLNKVHRFKHHQLKEYIFNDFKNIEREANLEETRIYNMLKDHVNEISNKTINSYNN